METTVSEILAKDLTPELKIQEILDSYDHIELSDYEMKEAIIVAKIKKEAKIKADRLKALEQENRKKKSEKFDFMAASTHFAARAENLFKGKFVIDEDNRVLFEMLCYYFNDDIMFVTMAEAYGVKNPSLEKGLLLAGNFGVGKSWMMRLFMQNKRQCYFIREAKKIADAFSSSKEKRIPEEYLVPFENAFEDPNVYYQKYSGLCVDDIGAERVKNNYGNVSNVIGDLLEDRYSFNHPDPAVPKLIGPMLHGATNLSASELKEYYGDRVASRMREIFNFIVCKGEDRRK